MICVLLKVYTRMPLITRRRSRLCSAEHNSPVALRWVPGRIRLGSDSEDLPGFVVMTSSISKGTSCGQIFYDFYWGSGFLPDAIQGAKFRGGREPVLYLSNPDGMPAGLRRGMLDQLAEMNELRFQQVGDPEIQTRIAQYEMAYRMQTSVPDLIDFSDEPEHVLEMYGPQVREPGTFAYNCLLSRRLAERGVRFVQCMSPAGTSITA